MKTNLRVSSVKGLEKLIGINLGTHIHGVAGRKLESVIKAHGVEFNFGSGPDLPDYGIEVKSRCITAVSPQTVGSMSVKSIIKTPYEQSLICEKIQRQIRVSIDDTGNVIAADFHDFTDCFSQDLIREAYEHARQQVIADPTIKHTKVSGHVGYFERTSTMVEGQLAFRISHTKMKKLIELRTKSTFTSLFTLDQ